MAIGNAHGAHIVTIEGINIDGLNAVQQAFAEEGATQCGFCTPGFIMSLTGSCLSDKNPSQDDAIEAMNGNICRCTGYKSIERAAGKIVNQLKGRTNDPVQYAIDNVFVPSYFSGIPNQLAELITHSEKKFIGSHDNKTLGGGTDLYVQQHSEMLREELYFISGNKEYNGIRKEGTTCIIGGAATVTDLASSQIMNKAFHNLKDYIRLISSTPIRNMATVAGNFINASPIGDLTIFFLALDSSIVFENKDQQRQIRLRDLYKGYKQLDKMPDEILREIRFELPSASTVFNFEKVSKRTCLDIASVNSAIFLDLEEDLIRSAHLSAGGVSPIPLYLVRSSEFLTGKRITAQLVNDLLGIAQSEISPISDARGSEAYKRLLLSQLIKAHFITLFPALPAIKFLYTS